MVESWRCGEKGLLPEAGLDNICSRLVVVLGSAEIFKGMDQIFGIAHRMMAARIRLIRGLSGQEDLVLSIFLDLDGLSAGISFLLVRLFVIVSRLLAFNWTASCDHPEDGL
ncbi:hypothetical protein NPIL_341851 [Nephila pilipes]|uniref:Uncharacterized protein n=1 Tax=Nephila pilipes TaxID=299642 RepID=A0A8X6PVC7_NEPPI|nr:hypothetical protein NPIL_341851 [Nephila pilipes]